VELASVVYDLKVVAVNAPSPVGVGEQVLVDVQLENKSNIATTFDLILRDTTDNVIIETRTVSLARGAVETSTIVWDTTTASLGIHTLEAEIVFVGDINPGDNVNTKDVTVNS